MRALKDRARLEERDAEMLRLVRAKRQVSEPSP